ncbi:MAG: hypothetical protein AB7K24_29680, partial [Gemmataceae bacterium]
MNSDNDPHSPTSEEPGSDSPVDAPRETPAGEDTEDEAAAKSAVAEEPKEKKAPEWTLERIAVERQRLDLALVVIVLLIVVFLASFPAANSELWRHLATGRLVAARAFEFGSDPYTATTNGVRWVDHSWLFDLKLYELARVFGGPESLAGGAALIIAKMMLVVILAWVLMSIQRSGQGWWAPASTTLLALLAMTPQLQLGPGIVSLLFLGITLYFLTRPEPATPPIGLLARALSSTPLCLFVVCAMWVNMDRWFILGPVTVALFWLGETIQAQVAPIRTGPEAPPPDHNRRLLFALGAGLLGCLLNPYHVNAFALPRELAFYLSSSPLKGDPAFDKLLFSPLQAEYLRNQSLGLNVAGMAYLPLILLGVISFVITRGIGWRWWRVLLWAGFFIPSVMLATFVPYFAVVAAPITALNLQDYGVAHF